MKKFKRNQTTITITTYDLENEGTAGNGENNLILHLKDDDHLKTPQVWRISPMPENFFLPILIFFEIFFIFIFFYFLFFLFYFFFYFRFF